MKNFQFATSVYILPPNEHTLENIDNSDPKFAFEEPMPRPVAAAVKASLARSYCPASPVEQTY